MRIIAGQWKGRIIGAPAAEGVRPTTDRLRETIFSMLQHITDMEGVHVADLCAGTGALGFEALSRGAEFCWFVERQRRMTAVIEQTARTFGAAIESYRIICGDAMRFAAQFPPTASACDIVFFDPPYAELLCNKLVQILRGGHLLRPGGILIAEHAANEGLLLPTGWQRLAERSVGYTVVDILRSPARESEGS